MRCLALVLKNQALDQDRASLSAGNGEVKAAGEGRIFVGRKWKGRERGVVKSAIFRVAACPKVD